MNKQITYYLSSIRPLLVPTLLQSLMAALFLTLLFFLYLNSTPNSNFKEIGIDPKFENFILEPEIVKYFESDFKTNQNHKIKVYRSANSFIRIRILSQSKDIDINQEDFLKAEKILLKNKSLNNQNNSYFIFHPQLRNLREHFETKILLMFVLSFGFFYTALFIQKLGSQIQEDLKK